MGVEGDDALSMELIACAGGTMYIQADDGTRKPKHNTTPGQVCCKHSGAYRLSTVPGPSVNDPTDFPRCHSLSARTLIVHDATVCQHNASIPPSVNTTLRSPRLLRSSLSRVISRHAVIMQTRSHRWCMRCTGVRANLQRAIRRIHGSWTLTKLSTN